MTAQFTSAGPGTAQQPQHWVGTWEAAAQQPRSWQTAALGERQSYRMLVHTTIGGTVARIRFGNAFGTAPMILSDVHAAVPVGARPVAALQPETIVPVHFSGGNSIAVPPGGDIYSDPVPVPVPADGYLAISFYAPRPPAEPTVHTMAMTISYLTLPGAGDHAADIDATAFTVPTPSWYFVTGVDVTSPPTKKTVVALGDSITDCCVTLPGTDTRWPDLLARRMAAAGLPTSVVNAGISGNEVSRDRDGNAVQGQAATTRLTRDVLGEPNVGTVILFEGVNDVGTGVPAEEIIAAYRDIADTLHRHHIRVLVATLTPTAGSVLYGPGYTTNAPVRDTVNAWIRHQHLFDGIIDFATAATDPADPEHWNPALSSGDGLHPNPAGMRALADAIDLGDLLPTG
ncbi:GDSL-type esterase/lipase family protein [Nocardia sp. NPDC004068]|uniref:GDSL-type esterase/lipase family protein n=1 Tax=Nocardia sp. NPDC004068 TaxID=3364303 RepID=UPI00369A661A